MRINVAVPEAHVEAPVLDAALESVTRLNESMMARHEIPSFAEALKRGIRWKPEPPGAEHFDHAKVILGRGWGDCDDLAPYHAATLRHSGEDPGATAIVQRSGPKRWHAVVQRSDGRIDDPSKAAGMGQPMGVVGQGLPMMWGGVHGVGGSFIIRPQIAMRPVRGAYQARADIPWHWREHLDDEPTATDYAMTALHTAPVASTALVGALEQGIELAEAAGFAHPDHLDRLCCLSDAVQGAHWSELAEVYGSEHADAAMDVVGSFFGSIAKGFKSIAPALSKAVQFVPGVGPIASTALDMGARLIPSGGGGHAAAPPRLYAPPPGAFPPGAAATHPGSGRLRPGGAELLRELVFFG